MVLSSLIKGMPMNYNDEYTIRVLKPKPVRATIRVTENAGKNEAVHTGKEENSLKRPRRTIHASREIRQKKGLTAKKNVAKPNNNAVINKKKRFDKRKKLARNVKLIKIAGIAGLLILLMVLGVKYIPSKIGEAPEETKDMTVAAEESVDSKELTTVLTKSQEIISETIKDVTPKEVDNEGEAMPVLEFDDGRFIGFDDNNEAYYIEITEGSNSDAAIAGVCVGDNVHQAAHMFEQAGAVEDIQAEQYWAELFFNDGKPNIYILCFNYAVPDSDKIIAFMATIDRDTVIGVSAEVK